MSATGRTARRLATALIMMIASARVAGAQTVYAGVSFSFQRLTEGEKAPAQAAKTGHGCPDGNGGTLCGDASGVAAGAVASAGIFLNKRLSVAVEGSIARSRSGSASYDGYSHTDNDVTTATFVHSGDRSIGAVLRGHVRVGTRGVSVEPVAGVLVAHTTESLIDQKRTFTSPGLPTISSTPADKTTSRVAPGFTAGVDVSGPRSKSGVSFLGMARFRWIHWPQTGSTSYGAVKDPVPMSVGRSSLQFGAGVRWGR
jgi:hypothetical protein